MKNSVAFAKYSSEFTINFVMRIRKKKLFENLNFYWICSFFLIILVIIDRWSHLSTQIDSFYHCSKNSRSLLLKCCLLAITKWYRKDFWNISNHLKFEFFFSEQSIASARASVMIYDDINKKWVPSGTSSGLSKVHIYQHTVQQTFRVVGRKLQDHEVRRKN